MLLDPCNALAEWKPVEWRESSKTTVFRFSREVPRNDIKKIKTIPYYLLRKFFGIDVGLL